MRRAVKGRGGGVVAERTEECRESVVQGTVPIAAAGVGVGVVAGGRAQSVRLNVKAIHLTAWMILDGGWHNINFGVAQCFRDGCANFTVCLPVPDIKQSLCFYHLGFLFRFAQERNPNSISVRDLFLAAVRFR